MCFTRAGLWLAIALVSALGCSGDRALQVGGSAPYVRCLAAEPEPQPTARSGSTHLWMEGRQLHVEGLAADAVVAAFSGPAFYQAPGPSVLGALRAAKPDLLLLLGDVGDAPSGARATLAALASLPMPTLVLAGGRDTRQGLAESLASLAPDSSPVFDISAMTAIRLGAETLIPVAGALDGHYARSSAACGYAREDLRRLPDGLKLKRTRATGRVWLVGWEVPESWGHEGERAIGAGPDLGEEPAVELARKIGAVGGVFAWPPAPSNDGSATPQGAFEMISVPRLTGAPAELADGSRVGAGFALLELGGRGLRLLEVRSTE